MTLYQAQYKIFSNCFIRYTCNLSKFFVCMDWICFSKFLVKQFSTLPAFLILLRPLLDYIFKDVQSLDYLLPNFGGISSILRESAQRKIAFSSSRVSQSATPIPVIMVDMRREFSITIRYRV